MNLKQLGILGIGTVVGLTVSAGLISTNANPNTNINLITSEEAKEIILKKVPNGTFTEFSFDSDEKTPKYDSTVIKDNIEYEVDIDAKTGEVIKFEKEKISINKTSTNSSVSTNNTTTNSNNTANSSATNNNTVSNNTATNTQNNNVNSANAKASTTLIGEAKAKQIMLDKVPGATFRTFYLDNDYTPEYEGELIKGNVEYDITVDAKTGKIIDYSEEIIKTQTQQPSNNTNNTVQQAPTQPSNTQTSSSLIGEAKAKQIMLNKVPGATFRTFYLDNDYTPEYEGELIKDNVEYDISVDAKTGKIIEFSQEALYDNDDRYDDDRYDDDYDDRYDNDYDDDDYDDGYDD